MLAMNPYPAFSASGPSVLANGSTSRTHDIRVLSLGYDIMIFRWRRTVHLSSFYSTIPCNSDYPLSKRFQPLRGGLHNIAPTNYDTPTK
eukprot:scaffold3079_cov174-Amphora_coffeaeformis.AAC.26